MVDGVEVKLNGLSDLQAVECGQASRAWDGWEALGPTVEQMRARRAYLGRKQSLSASSLGSEVVVRCLGGHGHSALELLLL